MFRNDGQALDELDIVNAFNYGMAIWGMDGTIKIDAFLRVVDLDGPEIQKKNLNYLQCMAIAYWAIGSRSKALDYIDRAQEAMSDLHGRAEFSCWRYLQIGADRFKVDLDDIRNLIENDSSQMPRFVIKAST